MSHVFVRRGDVTTSRRRIGVLKVHVQYSRSGGSLMSDVFVRGGDIFDGNFIKIKEMTSLGVKL